jgi:hypothetical protein
MSISSRFLCLSSAILLSTLIGCKHCSSCSNGSCGGAQGASAPVGAGAGYTTNSGNAIYSKYGSPNTGAAGMTAGQPGYPAPTTSSTQYQGMGSAH